jgi:hypothetical protein
MKENKKRNLISIIILIIGLVVIIGSLVWHFALNGKKEEPPKEEPTEQVVQLKLEDIPEKVTKFIEVGLHDQQYGYLAEKFIKGASKLDAADKNVMAIYLTNTTEITKATVPDKYKGTEDEEYLLGDPKGLIASIDDFKNNYKLLFNEEVDLSFIKSHTYHDGEFLSVCPLLYGVLEEEKVIVLSKNCGGTNIDHLETKVYDYKKVGNNYEVYQYVGYKSTNDKNEEYYLRLDRTIIEVDKFEGNEDKFSTLVWTFDKDYKFVKSKVVNKDISEKKENKEGENK